MVRHLKGSGEQPPLLKQVLTGYSRRKGRKQQFATLSGYERPWVASLNR